jgi:RNA-directed DNA polymerase
MIKMINTTKITKMLKNMGDSDLAKLWKQSDNRNAEAVLARLQKDIAIAALSGKLTKIRLAQRRLIDSLEARVIAVKHVSRRAITPGIDGVLWKTNAEKMQAALSLNTDRYRAMPTRLFVLNSPGKKSRHIQIPTVFDQAMQVLYAFALDPVAEVRADRTSFAARRCRSLNDLHVYLVKALDPKQPYGQPLYLIRTDVKMCYASISHDWLRKNIPMDTHVLNQFVTSGYVFRGEFFPPDDDSGIPIGGSISHILANMTLDGAQRAIYQELHGRDTNIDYIDGQLLRFADDMLILVRSYAKTDQVINILSKFLENRGMKLSADKTKTVPIQIDGFDFFSRHYRCLLGWVEVTPSEEAVISIENTIRECVRSYHGGQRSLIEKLNQILTGWATYHKISNASDAFRRVDTFVTALLLNLCERLYPHTPRQKLIDRFFYEYSPGEYTYALENKPNVRVVRLYNDVTLIRHKPVMLAMNPYLDESYFTKRDQDREMTNMTGKFKKIWKRQGERCYYCGKPILVDEPKDVAPINPGLPQTAKNTAYVHRNCSYSQVEFINSDYEFVGRFNLHRFLEEMLVSKSQTSKKSKYYSLMLFFRQQTKNIITLKFSQIEEILNQKLCKSAYRHASFWSQDIIGSCWRQNGYTLRGLQIKSRLISFERIERQRGETMELPDWLFNRLPKNACTEIKVFLSHIKTKWGL